LPAPAAPSCVSALLDYISVIMKRVGDELSPSKPGTRAQLRGNMRPSDADGGVWAGEALRTSQAVSLDFQRTPVLQAAETESSENGRDKVSQNSVALVGGKASTGGPAHR